MIDTVAIVSPPLSAADEKHISDRLDRLQKDQPDGEILMQFFSGSLLGSWDHRLSITIVHYNDRPALKLEGSVHKHIEGHNIQGGPTDLLAACSWLIDRAASFLDVPLPPSSEWIPYRVDIARAWRLPSPAHVAAAISALASVRVRNKKPRVYADETVVWPGHHFAVKAYHKGPEFRVHDRKNLRRFAAAQPELPDIRDEIWDADDPRRPADEPGIDAGHYFQCIADVLLRVEVEIKRKGIIQRIGTRGTILDLTPDILADLYWKHAEPMTISSPDRKTVNTFAAVLARLQEDHTPSAARALVATWQILSVDEDIARASMSPRTFYDHRAKLRASACDWRNGDIVLRAPIDIAPLTFRPECDWLLADEESPTVSHALSAYRKAA